MIKLIMAHWMAAGFGAYYLYSAAIGSLDKPDDKSGKFYRWFYRFNHLLAGNVKYALTSKFPAYVKPDETPAA